jgi:hypothetical protein
MTRYQEGTRDYFLLHSVQFGPGTCPDTYPLSTGGSFPNGKAMVVKLTPNLHLVPWLRCVELYLHSPVCLLAQCLIKYRDNITFAPKWNGPRTILRGIKKQKLNELWVSKDLEGGFRDPFQIVIMAIPWKKRDENQNVNQNSRKLDRDSNRIHSKYKWWVKTIFPFCNWAAFTKRPAKRFKIKSA